MNRTTKITQVINNQIVNYFIEESEIISPENLFGLSIIGFSV
ncbi:MAG: hypothetical protein PF487_02045 [Bacteroidales bacterium]|nr:hypothetical protein [Bacteroidales bacterium]